MRDACEATYRICTEGALGETYHIAPREVLTVRAVAQMICAQLGLDHEQALEDAPERLGKDKAYFMDASKLRALGWSERIGIKEGMAEYGN